MKTKSLLTAFVSYFILLHSAFAQGSLTPPGGAPVPTMKTLDQIYARVDARNPITSASSAVTISVPGSYYLTTNLTVSSGNAITIATNGVTLDLNGWTIKSTAASAAGYAILINSGLHNLTIEHGHIESGVTNNGSGVYSGSGFAYGIYFTGTAPVNTRVAGISVAGCLNYGMYVGMADSTVVESCTVRTVGAYGIFASTIKGCVAVDCGSIGIVGDQVSDSRGEATSSYGLYAYATAQNCFGSSTTGIGLNATSAQNCFGSSSSSTGLNASTAINCYCSSASGNGLTTTIANNCIGSSLGNGTGVNASSVATGCYGASNSGIGLSAFIANGCRGQSSVPALNLSVTHNVNSF